MKLTKTAFILISTMIWSLSYFGQANYNPLSWSFSRGIEQGLVSDSTNHHSTLRPIIGSKYNWKTSSNYKSNITTYSVLTKKLLKDNLIHINKKGVDLIIDPIFDFSFGRDLSDTSNRNLYTNTRGVHLELQFEDKLAISTSLRENQVRLPSYLNDFVNDSKVYLGQARVKDFKKGGFDFASAEGYLSYSPFKNWNVTLGHGKHFIGEGYRSMILSDNSVNYPYIKSSVSFWNNIIEYSAIYAMLQDLERIPRDGQTEALFKRKNAMFLQLGVLIGKKVEVSLFEGNLIRRFDDSLMQLKDNFINYIPLIGLNTAIHGFEKINNNTILGLSLKYKATDWLTVYGQLALDDPSKNKIAWQVGAKSYNIFSIKNLDIRLEYNSALPGSYLANQQRQNWVHYNQALAHPMGEGFSEVLARIRYAFKNVELNYQINYSLSRSQKNTIYSGNAVYDDYEVWKTITHENRKLLHQNIELSYLINPKNDFRVYTGFTKRDLLNEDYSSTNYFFIGIRTLLNNKYSDF